MKPEQTVLFQVLGSSLFALAAYLMFPGLSALIFMVGVACGVALPWLDKWYLFRWYEGKTVESMHHYITRSLLFILAFSAAGIFVVTSTSGFLGRGFVLGLGLVLLSELMGTFHSPAQLNRMLGVKKPLRKEELQYLVGGYSVGYALLVGLAFFP